MRPRREAAVIARRAISALLVLVLGLSSVESLWGDVPAEVPTGTERVASAAGADTPAPQGSDEEAGEDCPCLCDCACVNAQRVIAPVAVLSPDFSLAAPSPLPRASLRAPRSTDPEPHLRPPVP